MDRPEGADVRAVAVPTLAQRIEQQDAVGLPVGFVSRCVSEAAAALDLLHASGKTHGAVQAARIAVPARGPAYLLEPDWPAAAAGSVGADVAGLVSAAYHAICGVPPSFFRAMSSPDPSTTFLVSPTLHRPDLPPGVSDVLTRGLAPMSRERYASAGDFAAALRGAAGQAPGMAEVAPPKRLLLPLAALAVLLVLALGAWLGHQRQAPRPPGVVAVAPVPVLPDAVPGVAPQELSSAPQTAVKNVSGRPPLPPLRPVQTAAGQKTAAVPAAAPAPVAPLAAPAVARPPSVPGAAREAVLANPAPPRRSAPPRSASAGRAYLRVYARQFVSMTDVISHRLSSVPARRVLVDGNPSRALSAGHWASVSPGKHRLGFYPIAGVPFDPNTRFWVQVGPRRRLSFQVPLPRHPGGIQAPDPKKSLPRPV